MIFVNITTTDLERSKAFYTALGCDINPMFTDENAACVVWDENTNFMVLTRGHFSQFTDKQIADPHTAAHRTRGLRADTHRHREKARPGAGLAAWHMTRMPPLGPVPRCLVQLSCGRPPLPAPH
ncbi:VOC family protein [Streptomyces sp. NBC_01174]|uniref:VOC family protein n=1 Tax=Streptomyces sp. NBC_01174 TaxID=2903758 RepID=UPI003866D201|nr:glyoxalase [Streptomyces sp. NBC_01174]WSS80764.1 glyoxalase [Streptomyces sp. NBC_01174]